jgi:hypothetical protein
MAVGFIPAQSRVASLRATVQSAPFGPIRARGRPPASSPAAGSPDQFQLPRFKPRLACLSHSKGCCDGQSGKVAPSCATVLRICEELSLLSGRGRVVPEGCCSTQKARLWSRSIPPTAELMAETPRILHFQVFISSGGIKPMSMANPCFYPRRSRGLWWTGQTRFKILGDRKPYFLWRLQTTGDRKKRWRTLVRRTSPPPLLSPPSQPAKRSPPFTPRLRRLDLDATSMPPVCLDHAMPQSLAAVCSGAADLEQGLTFGARAIAKHDLAQSPVVAQDSAFAVQLNQLPASTMGVQSIYRGLPKG